MRWVEVGRWLPISLSGMFEVSDTVAMLGIWNHNIGKTIRSPEDHTNISILHPAAEAE